MPKEPRLKRPNMHSAETSKMWLEMGARHCCSHCATWPEWVTFDTRLLSDGRSDPKASSQHARRCEPRMGNSVDAIPPKPTL